SANDNIRGGVLMRIARSTLIGTAVAMALFGRNGAVHAQTSGDQTTSNRNLEEVVVTGIRASLEVSLEAKRAADSVEDVISSEDIGKMPDKNIADSLKRVAGVTISSAGATEGGFDENDRVSMRGTGPSLTQTLINGHNVSSGDWVLLQGFYEKRHLRRDGVELLGYDTIGSNSILVKGSNGFADPQPVTAVPVAAHPNLAGVQYPTDIGAAFFEQERKRTGGLIDAQFKPNDNVDLDLSGFYSKLDGPNYNRN